MSKLFLAFFIIGVLVVIAEAWPRGRGHRSDMWERLLGRDIPSRVGRGFRRWMRRGNQDESGVSESEVDQETPTDDVTDDDDSDDDSDDRLPWYRDYMRNMRRRQWRRRQGHHRRGERCRGPECRRHRQNMNNEEVNSGINGTNGNLPAVNRPDPDINPLDSDNLPEPGVDRIPGRHRLGRFHNRNNRLADRQAERRINRNRQHWQRRMDRWRQKANRRNNRKRERQGRRNDRRLRYLKLRFCEYVREIGNESEYSDICETETTVDAVNVTTELPPEVPEDLILEDGPSL